VKRGDIYLVTLDPTLGHERQGTRPVLIVSPDRFNAVTRVPIVVPITSGGAFVRNAGFAVSLAGAGTRTTGFPVTAKAFGVAATNWWNADPMPYSSEISGDATFGGTTNPRAALIYKPFEQTTLMMLYGQSFRAPNDAELYFQVPSLNGQTPTANPNFKPETARTSELVLGIAAASAEQNSGVVQINGAITQISQAVQQSAAASEELASTSEAVNAQAQELQFIMDFFTLAGTPGMKSRKHTSTKTVSKATGSRSTSRVDLNEQEFTRF